ncbi:hypothetical protein D3C75_1016200 [compost metagenome]
MQRSVHSAQMRIGMRVWARFAAMFTQVIRQRLGRAVPAGSDTCTALPETRTREVLAWRANERAWSIVESHLDTGGGGHANGLPVFDVQALAWL